MITRIERMTVEALSLLIVVSAVGGAVGLIGGGIDFPLEWLNGTPFASYAGPGIILGLVVGGSALVAAVMVLRGHPLAAQASIAAGLIQVGWIVGEVVLVGVMAEAVGLGLQVLFFAVGGLLAALAADLWLRGTAPRN